MRVAPRGECPGAVPLQTRDVRRPIDGRGPPSTAVPTCSRSQDGLPLMSLRGRKRRGAPRAEPHLLTLSWARRAQGICEGASRKTTARARRLSRHMKVFLRQDLLPVKFTRGHRNRPGRRASRWGLPVKLLAAAGVFLGGLAAVLAALNLGAGLASEKPGSHLLDPADGSNVTAREARAARFELTGDWTGRTFEVMVRACNDKWHWQYVSESGGRSAVADLFFGPPGPHSTCYEVMPLACDSDEAKKAEGWLELDRTSTAEPLLQPPLGCLKGTLAHITRPGGVLE
jgi:hypothetical protein